MPIATLKHGALTAETSDGTVTINLRPGPGNFNLPDLEEGNYEVADVFDRGEFLERVYTNKKLIEWSIELLQDGKLTDATGKPLDLVLKQGPFAGKATVDPGGLVWTFNATFTITRNGVTSTVKLYNNRGRITFTEDGAGNKLAIAARAAGTGSGGFEPVVIT